MKGTESTTKKINVGMTTTIKKQGNITNTKKGVSTQKEEKQNEDFARNLFEDRLPEDLVPKKDQEEKKKKDSPSKEDTKNLNNNGVLQEKVDITTEKKEDTQIIDKTDHHSSSINETSDDDKKKESINNQKNKESIEKDLESEIYITLTETQTVYMYFAPSQKYLTIANNDKEIEEEKEKKKYYDEFKNKQRNKDLFAKKGAQTINPFKRSQNITTSEIKDEDIDKSINEGVNALKWHIIDTINEEKNKKEDETKIFQKKLDKKIRREMKTRLRQSDFVLDPSLSYSQHKSNNLSESHSIIDTKINSSMQSSIRDKKPKVRGSMKESADEKTGNLDKSKHGQSSPTSSQAFKNSETGQIHSEKSTQLVSKITKALDEVLPNSLLHPLKYVERLLSQNKFHFRQIAYKNYPVDLDEYKSKQNSANNYNSHSIYSENNGEEENKQQDNMNDEEVNLIKNVDTRPKLKPLFQYSGKNVLEGCKFVVNSMDWNPYNKDLLAASYGDYDIDSKKEGLLLFWTLKNPLHPERVIKTNRGITSCHFSTKNPFLVAAADYSGEIMIYDLRTNTDKPVADSTEQKEKHTDIVWDVKWVEKQNDKNEMLVSISSDGKVKEWSLKKGLEVSDLLKMKKTISLPDKTLSPFSKYGKSNKDSLVFRDANGLSFDFPKNDSTVYYISLEECTIHRCRVSYRDQYTDTYYGHQGPVYKIKCNPYDPNVLLSCSYDWTMKIWNSKSMYPLMNCHSMNLKHQINDVEWSPYTSTIFGCVADDGRIEIWDLAKLTIDPVAEYKSEKEIPKKSIKFSSSSQIVATGDNDFGIDIFRIYNLEHEKVSDDDQIHRLRHILNQNSEHGKA